MNHPHPGWMERVIFEAIASMDFDILPLEKMGLEKLTDGNGAPLEVEHIGYLANVGPRRGVQGVLVVFKDGSEFEVGIEMARAPYRSR